eukprot:7046795-Prymnesium_polylepis.1
MLRNGTARAHKLSASSGMAWMCARQAVRPSVTARAIDPRSLDSNGVMSIGPSVNTGLGLPGGRVLLAGLRVDFEPRHGVLQYVRPHTVREDRVRLEVVVAVAAKRGAVHSVDPWVRGEGSAIAVVLFEFKPIQKHLPNPVPPTRDHPSSVRLTGLSSSSERGAADVHQGGG